MSDILTESIRRAVRNPDVIEALCKSLESQLQAQLRAQLGGGEIYVSKRPSKTERDARIKAAFDGANYDQIGRAEQLTPRQVRRIVHGGPAKK